MTERTTQWQGGSAPGTSCLPEAPVYVENGRPVEALKNVGQHSHNDFDEVYFYYLIVLALTDNAKFHEGEFEPRPAPDTFKF